jgi:hypothetical protein
MTISHRRHVPPCNNQPQLPKRNEHKDNYRSGSPREIRRAKYSTRRKNKTTTPSILPTSVLSASPSRPLLLLRRAIHQSHRRYHQAPPHRQVRLLIRPSNQALLLWKTQRGSPSSNPTDTNDLQQVFFYGWQTGLLIVNTSFYWLMPTFCISRQCAIVPRSQGFDVLGKTLPVAIVRATPCLYPFERWFASGAKVPCICSTNHALTPLPSFSILLVFSSAINVQHFVFTNDQTMVNKSSCFICTIKCRMGCQG